MGNNEEVLSVKHLQKKYPDFTLRDISFCLEAGTITGFIGRNGAGKTTTLKSLLHLIHPDAGEIAFFGMDFDRHEREIKQQIGFISGGIDYYPKRQLRTITEVTRRFYAQWDQAAYLNYMRRFGLAENKTPAQLSAGMRVKYALTLALSHRATLLLLDEPTSGLDPVSRDDLLDVFLDLVEEQNMSILFSTHITSDLEKCASHILYIRQGEIVGEGNLDAFLNQYQVVQLSAEQAFKTPNRWIGLKKERKGYCALVRREDVKENMRSIDATLEDVMVHWEKE